MVSNDPAHFCEPGFLKVKGMDQEILLLLSKVFEKEITEKDMIRLINEVVQWDSFIIMSLLTEVMTNYEKKIDLDNLFSVNTIGELVDLIKETIQ